MAPVTVPSHSRTIPDAGRQRAAPAAAEDCAPACRDTSEPFERTRIRLLAEHPGDLVAYLRP